jgi:hypothetical protein
MLSEVLETLRSILKKPVPDFLAQLILCISQIVIDYVQVLVLEKLQIPSRLDTYLVTINVK